MECNCKKNGVPFYCDVDKPYCGKAKLRYRIEYFIFEILINYLVDTITIISLLGVVVSILWVVFTLIRR